MAERQTGEQELTPTNITNLLRQVKFRFNKHWSEVGRRLNIDLENREQYRHKAVTQGNSDFAEAFEECIEEWWRNSHEPSWDKILPVIAAVDKSAARHIRRLLGLPSVVEEQTVLESLSDDRLTGLGSIPGDLTETLKAEGVAVESESAWLSDVRTWKEVIKGLMDSLKNDRKKELNFGKVLFDYEETREIGKEILQEEPTTPVVLSPTYEPEFDSLFGKFSSFLGKIRPKLVSELSEVISTKGKAVKRYLKRLPKVGSTIQNFEDIEEILDVIEESCSCTNVEILRGIAEEYNCHDVLQDIDEYMRLIDKFTDELRDNLKKRLPMYLCSGHAKEPLICERLEFKLKWAVDEISFKSIEFLLYKAFEGIAKNIVVLRINGGSVSVLCYIPRSLVQLAIYKAQKNMEFLEKQRVIQLSIGYVTLITKSVEKEVEEEIEEKELKVKEKSIEDTTMSDTKEVRLQELKEQLEEKNKQLEERCTYWQSVAQSSSKDNTITKLLERLKEYEKEQQSLRHDIKNTNTEKAILIKNLRDIQAENTNLVKNLEDANTKIAILIKDLRDTQAENTNLVKNLDDKGNQLKAAERSEDLKQQEVCALENEVKELKEAETKMKKMTAENGSETYKKMYKAATTENEKLKKEQEEHKSQIQEIISARVPTLYDDWREPHTPPVQVLLTSFASYQKNNDHWYSPSFYSHEKGYKLCLRVRANGEKKGMGTHLSIHVHLMRGEYDDILEWPVRGKITIQLMNRKRNEGHFTGDIEFTDQSSQEATSRVINGIQISSGTMAFVGQGGEKFAPLAMLTEYLKDDSIRLCIKSVELNKEIVRIPTQALSSQDFVMEFRIKKFSARKKSNAECASDPFYSHEKGYKFVLLVYPNGVGNNKGKSISAFIHIMRGENDGKLKFPFRGEFTLQAVNCRSDQDHAEKIIRINDETDPDYKYGGRVSRFNPIGRSFQGYGFPKFLLHDLLEHNEEKNTQYLGDDDSLLLRITNITVKTDKK